MYNKPPRLFSNDVFAFHLKYRAI